MEGRHDLSHTKSSGDRMAEQLNICMIGQAIVDFATLSWLFVCMVQPCDHTSHTSVMTDLARYKYRYIYEFSIYLNHMSGT